MNPVILTLLVLLVIGQILTARYLRRKIKQLSDDLAQAKKIATAGAGASAAPSPYDEIDFHVVLSLPKVGGSTLSGTLWSTFPAGRIYHVHALSPDGMEKMHALGERSLHADERDLINEHVGLAKQCRRSLEINRLRHGHPAASFICGVRDPIALMLSSAFQSHRLHLDTPSDFTVDSVRELIMDESRQDLLMLFHGAFDAWFDKEIRECTGIDVFAEPFDPDRGYRILRKEGVDLLVFRQDNLDALRDILAEFYHLAPAQISMTEKNRAEDKDYAAHYRDIRDQLKFPSGFLDRIYGSRYAKHFYSDEERAAFRKRWEE